MIVWVLVALICSGAAGYPAGCRTLTSVVPATVACEKMRQDRTPAYRAQHEDSVIYTKCFSFTIDRLDMEKLNRKD